MKLNSSNIINSEFQDYTFRLEMTTSDMFLNRVPATMNQLVYMVYM